MLKKENKQATTSATSTENNEEDTIRNDNLLNLLQVKDTQVSFLYVCDSKNFYLTFFTFIVA